MPCHVTHGSVIMHRRRTEGIEISLFLSVLLGQSSSRRVASRAEQSIPPFLFCTRFYAGAPLIYTSEDGVDWKLGTLCVINPEPRTISDDEIELLEMLARLVVAELELRMKMRRSLLKVTTEADINATTRAVQMNTAYIGQVAHDLRTPLNSFSLGLEEMVGHKDTTPDMMSTLETMKISAELMEMTCTKAVDYLAMDDGKTLAAKKAPFILEEVLKKSQIVVEGYTHESKNVEYIYHIDAGEQPSFPGQFDPLPAAHSFFTAKTNSVSRG